MSFIRSFCLAFSLYSKLPVPRVAWKKENMKYVFCFFPLVGVVTALLCLGWYFLSERVENISELARISITVLIPVFVTGGIHLDGYMDVMDALHSWKDREKKAQILKDPHIGAFAVIHLLIYYLLLLAAFSQIKTAGGMCVAVSGFYLSRLLSALSAVTFPIAKKEGMLYELTSAAGTGTVRFSLILQLLICAGIMLASNVVMGGAVLVANIALMVYLYVLFVREFGGVSGDTCGFLSSLVELVTVLVTGILSTVG